MKYINYLKYIMVVSSFLSFIAIIGGCADKDDDGGGLADYCPFAVGNLWEYVLTATIQTPDTTVMITGDAMMEIVDDTVLINGQDVFKQETRVIIEGSVDFDIYYIADTDSSILRYSSVTDTIPEIMLELPLETGNSWTATGSTIATVLGRVFVSVPAGNYSSCWKIAYVTDGDTVYDYYAANIGLIKEYMSDTEGGMTLTIDIELEHADIQ